MPPEIANLKRAVEDGDLILAHDVNRGNETKQKMKSVKPIT